MALTINTNIKNEANGYSLDASQVKGGYVVVADEVERNAIPAATKVNGTTIYQADVGKEYRWNGSEWLEASSAGSDSKLDKQTAQTESDQVYGKLADGSQTMFDVTMGATATTIPRRDTAGRIQVADGVSGNDAVNFNQLSAVESSISGSNIQNGSGVNSTKQKPDGETFNGLQKGVTENDTTVEYNTDAAGQNSTVLGGKNRAEAKRSTAIGGYNVAAGASSLATGEQTITEGRCSFSTGQRTRAKGGSSLAAGGYSLALGDFSMTQGYQTKASGRSAMATGAGTSAEGAAALSGGTGTKAIGDASFSHGNATQAKGNYAAAFGSSTQANGVNSVAMGDRSVANAASSKVEGINNIANDSAYVAPTPGGGGGGSVEPTPPSTFNVEEHYGEGSHVEGAYNSAYGFASHAEGLKVSARGHYSHAEGTSTISEGESSHAEGEYTTASGMNSHTQGKWTKAVGDNSTAVGISTTATGNNSFAGGNNSESVKNGSFVHGFGLKSNQENQAVFGVYNAPYNATLLVVGNGQRDNYRTNAFEVYQDGRAKVQTAPQDNDDVTRKGDFKTINGNSLLGSGDLTIAGGGTEVTPNPTLSGSEAALSALQIGDTKYRIEGTLTTLMVGIDSSLLGG